jgi:hypothetical protein
MSKSISGFTANETRLVSQALQERYGHPIEPQSAEAELQLDLLKEELSICPTLHWQERGANFVIFKTGDSRFRCQFFYTDVEQYGTGIDEYDNLGDCVITLLQVQSDHERERAGMRSGMNAVDFDKANDGEDNFAPIII